MERDDSVAQRSLRSLPIVGAGSQHEDEALDYMVMPRGMTTFRSPSMPEPATYAAAPRVRALLQQVCAALARARGGELPQPLSLAALSGRERDVLQQLLGEGEVSVRVVTRDGLCVDAQEAVFTGVWRVLRQLPDGSIEDRIEVGPFPADVAQRAALDGEVQGTRAPAVPVPEGVMNGPSIAAELSEVWKAGAAALPHVVNLTLLPFTEADARYLDAVLGRGSLTILSRGYGNCRIVNTERPNTWHLTYYNSQDHVILRTLEVCPVPEVACAAGADFLDSEQRLSEVLAWLEESS